MATTTDQQFFVNPDSGTLVRVREVDDTFAYVETVWPERATYSMPIAAYDSQFVDIFKPATEEDLRRLTDGSKFRLPANAPESWKR